MWNIGCNSNLVNKILFIPNIETAEFSISIMEFIYDAFIAPVPLSAVAITHSERFSKYDPRIASICI